MTTEEEGRQYATALDEAERMLGFRLERFLGTTDTETSNATDFKRIATCRRSAPHGHAPLTSTAARAPSSQ